MEVAEVGDGGTDSVKLAEEMLWRLVVVEGRGGGEGERRWRGEEAVGRGGGEVVERENVGGDHGEQEE